MGVFKALFITHPAAVLHTAASHIVFGCFCAAVLALLSVFLSVHAGEFNPIPLILSAACLLLVIWSPSTFITPYKVWSSSTLAIGQAFITLFWFFYILPAGLIMQARGKDPLHLRFQPQARTYWKTPHPTTSMQKLG